MIPTLIIISSLVLILIVSFEIGKWTAKKELKRREGLTLIERALEFNPDLGYTDENGVARLYETCKIEEEMKDPFINTWSTPNTTVVQGEDEWEYIEYNQRVKPDRNIIPFEY